MIGKQKIQEIVNQYYKDSDKYLVNVKATPQNKIMVFIDGDKGVTISDCADLSKHIESFFDRDKEDFELEVSSAGIGKPLMVERQYTKNIGRNIAVSTNTNEKIAGKLINVNDKGIEVELVKKKSRNKKKDKEGMDEKCRFVSFNDIKEAKIKAVF